LEWSPAPIAEVDEAIVGYYQEAWRPSRELRSCLFDGSLNHLDGSSRSCFNAEILWLALATLIAFILGKLRIPAWAFDFNESEVSAPHGNRELNNKWSSVGWFPGNDGIAKTFEKVSYPNFVEGFVSLLIIGGKPGALGVL